MATSMTPFEMCRALRAHYEACKFSCKLCGETHTAPGIDMMNGVILFPREMMETERDNTGKFFAKCKKCPEKKKKDKNDG